MADEQWTGRLGELGAAAGAAGARWLTLRPASGGAMAAAGRRSVVVGGCTVTADPEVDGRERFVAAAEQLRRSGTSIDEASLAAVLNEPAEVDPDLTVVLGTNDRLPRALVWELAYTELVYLDLRWDQLAPAHLADAIASFARRHRRFGGVD